MPFIHKYICPAEGIGETKKGFRRPQTATEVLHRGWEGLIKAGRASEKAGWAWENAVQA